MKTDIKRKELMLNVIIIVLCANAALLFCRAVFLDVDSISGEIGSLFNSETPAANNLYTGNSSSIDISYPLYTLVTKEGGSHYAEKYKSNEKDSLSKMFTAIFGEALGSAGVSEPVSEAEWQSALSRPGVFLDYVFPQSLSYLSRGLRTACSNSLTNVIAKRFILSIGSDKLYLYYEKEGSFYRCETASSASTLSSKIAECPIGIAEFTFELGDKYKNLNPYFIFTNENFDVADINSKNPVTSALASKPLLDCFGINESASSHYTETDSSTVYVEGDKSLRINSDGLLIYNVSSSDGISITKDSSDPTLDQVLSTCGTITQSVFSQFGINPTLGVTDISIKSSPSDCTVSFGQCINGIPVTMGGEASIATYRIKGGSIVYIEIILRSYTAAKLSNTAPLPEKQMASIVNETSGEPVLIYVDDGGSAAVSWITLS